MADVERMGPEFSQTNTVPSPDTQTPEAMATPQVQIALLGILISQSEEDLGELTARFADRGAYEDKQGIFFAEQILAGLTAKRDALLGSIEPLDQTTPEAA